MVLGTRCRNAPAALEHRIGTGLGDGGPAMLELISQVSPLGAVEDILGRSNRLRKCAATILR